MADDLTVQDRRARSEELAYGSQLRECRSHVLVVAAERTDPATVDEDDGSYPSHLNSNAQPAPGLEVRPARPRASVNVSGIGS